MANVEKGGYRGIIAFVSWVLDKIVIDKGVKVHPTPQGAVVEIQQRLSDLGDGPPRILGGFVEEVKPYGSTVSAVKPGIDKL